MPRKRNPLAVAAGKLVLAIRQECDEANGQPDSALVMHKAHTLQHAAHNDCVPALLHGQSLTEYLDAGWVKIHPRVQPSVEAFTVALSALR